MNITVYLGASNGNDQNLFLASMKNCGSTPMTFPFAFNTLSANSPIKPHLEPP